MYRVFLRWHIAAMEFQIDIGEFLGWRYRNKLREDIEVERGRLHRLEIQL